MEWNHLLIEEYFFNPSENTSLKQLTLSRACKRAGEIHPLIYCWRYVN